MTLLYRPVAEVCSNVGYIGSVFEILPSLAFSVLYVYYVDV